MATLVKDIMTKRLKTLHPKEKLKTAKEIFEQYDIHHIPVEVMGEIKGILSQGDILYLEGVITNSFDEFIRRQRYEYSTVDELMTGRPYTIHQDALLAEAVRLMNNKRVNCLLVTESPENNVLAGILTSHDLLTHLETLL